MKNFVIYLYVIMLLIEYGELIIIFNHRYLVLLPFELANIFHMKTQILYLSFAFIITLNFVFFLFANDLKIRITKCFFYLTSLVYLMICASIILIQIMIGQIVYQIYFFHDYLGVVILISQSLLLVLWSIFSTYVYLSFNGNLEQKGLFLRMLGLFFISYLFLEHLFQLSYDEYASIIYCKICVCIFELIYIILSVRNIFITIGFNQRQNQLLKQLIYVYIAFLVFAWLPNSVTELDYNQLISFALFVSNYHIQVKQNKSTSQNSESWQYESCFYCREEIKTNDQILYFQASQNLFHQQCYYKFQEQTEEIQNFYLIKLIRTNYSQTPTQKKFFLILILLLNIIFYINTYLNYKEFKHDLVFNLMNIIEITLFAGVLTTQFIKNINTLVTKIQFYLYLSLFLCQFYHYWIVQQIFQLQNDTYCVEYKQDKYDQQLINKVYIGCTFNQYIKVLIQLVVYYFYLLLIQGYLFKQIIFIPLKSNKYFLFYSFLLMNLQTILFNLQNFRFRVLIQDYLLFQTIFNFIISCYFLKNKQQTQNENQFNYRITNIKILLFCNRVTFIILLLWLLVINGPWIRIFLRIPEYYPWIDNFLDFFYYNYFFAEKNWLFYRIMFIQVIINLCQGIYVNWCCVKKLNSFKQEKEFYSNQAIFKRPNVQQFYLLFCENCRKQFKKGNTIIYRSNCQHSLHKQCNKKWLNYPRCCLRENNYDIEIILE